MPLLQFYTSPNQLSQTEQDHLVSVITTFYARLFPAFFVIIIFNEVDSYISLSLPNLPFPLFFLQSTQLPRHPIEDYKIVNDQLYKQIKNGSFFIGGHRTSSKFVRLTIEHIAVNWNGDPVREKAYLDWMGSVLRDSFGKKKGWT